MFQPWTLIIFLPSGHTFVSGKYCVVAIRFLRRTEWLKTHNLRYFLNCLGNLLKHSVLPRNFASIIVGFSKRDRFRFSSSFWFVTSCMGSGKNLIFKHHLRFGKPPKSTLSAQRMNRRHERMGTNLHVFVIYGKASAHRVSSEIASMHLNCLIRRFSAAKPEKPKPVRNMACSFCVFFSKYYVEKYVQKRFRFAKKIWQHFFNKRGKGKKQKFFVSSDICPKWEKHRRHYLLFPPPTPCVDSRIIPDFFSSFEHGNLWCAPKCILQQTSFPPLFSSLFFSVALMLGGTSQDGIAKEEEEKRKGKTGFCFLAKKCILITKRNWFLFAAHSKICDPNLYFYTL